MKKHINIMKKHINLSDQRYNTFDFKDFIRPKSFFGPIYGWVWNDRLMKDEIVSQLQEMSNNGVRIICIIPEPQEFRPTTMVTRLAPDYLTKEYWEYYRFAVETAENLGMGCWFYDEGGWPSGGACGKVLAHRPDLIATVLDKEEIVFDDTCSNAETVAFFDGAKQVDNPKNGQKLTRFYIRKSGWLTNFYPSLLNKAAVETFISLTHEGLRASCGDLLGSSIFASFTDEPAVHCWPCPWEKDLLQDFEKTYGYNICAYLPSLFDGEMMGESGKRARIDYYDYWSERFAKTYFGRIREWCVKNGIFSLGHLNGDDYTRGSEGSYGNILRVLRQFDIPGIDVIWRQIYPIERKPYKEGSSPYQRINESEVNHYFPKYASSAAHQQGLRWALSETGGVYGNGFTFAQNYWVCGYQMVRGINLFTQMTISYGRKDYLMAEERPNYVAMMPGDFSWKAFNRWLSRSSYLCSLGKPCADIALYLPIRDIWVGGETSKAAGDIHDNVAYKLECLQIGFDIFDDDVLLGGVLKNGKLCFGGATYSTLIIPQNKYINREKVFECEKAGLRIIWINTIADLSKLENGVSRLAYTNCNDIRILKRKLSEGNLYMIFYEGMKDVKTTITFMEKIKPVEIDVENGGIRSVNGNLTENKFVFNSYLSSGESVFLLFSDLKTNMLPRFEKCGNIFSLKDFSVCETRRFIIGKETFEEDRVDAVAQKTTLGGWNNQFGEDFSGEARYICEFDLDEQQATTYRFLSLGRVEYSCNLCLNGHWQVLFRKPFVADITGMLKTGKNTLEIVVANTAANQFVFTKNFDDYSMRELGSYHEQSKQFEKETLGGGLYGPVELIEG